VNEPPTTDPTALVRLATALGVELEAAQAGPLLAYLDAMLALNEQINLTGIRDRETAVVLHVLDSLAFGLLRLQPRHVLDLGSGNGFPGVAVAALQPRASVVLLDRTGKKVRAIGSCLLTAKLSGIETLLGDAAQVPALHRELRKACDLVLARAVGAPTQLAEMAAPLLRHGGQMVLWLDADAEVPERLPGFRRQQQIGYDLPAPAARHRQIACWRHG